MSQCSVRKFNIDCQNVLRKLGEKIISLTSLDNSIDDVDLFTKACAESNISLETQFREHLSEISLVTCQIVINENMCFLLASGRSRDESLKNAIQIFFRSFFQSANNQNDYLTSRTDIKLDMFIDESLENYKDLITVDYFLKLCRDFMRNTVHVSNKVNYNNMKTIINKNINIMLSEYYTSTKEGFTCSIILNNILILQQSKGNSKKKAMENAVKDFLESYLLDCPASDTDSLKPINKQLIIEQMAAKFQEKKSQSDNYWNMIQECSQDLQYPMEIKSNKNSCTVTINNIVMVKTSARNEHSNIILACKQLIEMFTEASNKAICKDLSTNPQIPNNHSTKTIQQIIDNLRTNLMDKPPNQNRWPFINSVFLDENMKLELEYKTTSNERVMCSFYYQHKQLISAEGVDKNTAREEAARELLNNYQDV